MRPKELSFGLCIVIFPPLKTEKGRETSAFSSLNWADKSPYTHQKPEDSSVTIIFPYLPEISTGCCRNTLPGRRKQDVMRRCKVGTSRERDTHCQFLWPETYFDIRLVHSLPPGKPPPITTLSKPG